MTLSRMRRNYAHVLIILLLLMAPGRSSAQILEADSLALIALYDSTDGANWNHVWDLDSTVATWEGVTLKEGRVTKLDLDQNHLVGTIPPAIGDLTELVELYLYSSNSAQTDFSNQLSGPIPPELGSLTKLVSLHLFRNLLTGAIPPELANLNSLNSLILYQNQLSGEIPAFLGSLTNLGNLDLTTNQFSGAIPPELGALSNLVILSLGGNDLTGVIPSELGDLTNLVHMHLFGNQLSGSVPESFLSLTKLQLLSIRDNNIDELPDLNPITSLKWFHAQNNKLDFADLLPNIGAASLTYDYQPQQPATPDSSVSWGLGGRLVLRAPDFGGPVDSYTWYLNGISQLTGDTLLIPTVGFATDDLYHVTANNQSLPDLDLPSGEYILNWVQSVSPTWGENPDAIALEEDTTHIVLHASDIYNDPLIFTAMTDTSAVDAIVVENVIHLVPDSTYRGIAKAFTSATDGGFTILDTIEFTFNSPPVVAAHTDVTIDEDTWYELIVDALDSDQLSKQVSLAGGEVTVDFSDNGFSLTPDTNWHGEKDIEIQVSDGVSTVRDTFLLTVTPVYDALSPFDLLIPAADSVLIVTPQMIGDTVKFEWESAYTPDGGMVLYNIVWSMPNNSWQGTVAQTYIDTVGFFKIDSNWVIAAIADSLEEIAVSWTVSAIHPPWAFEPTGGERSFTLKLARELLAIGESTALPQSFALHPNYPNPFNPTTTLRFDLPEAADVSLIVYDLRGREITTLIADRMAGGYHMTVWNGRDGAGKVVPSGIYVARLVTAAHAKSMKMVLLK